MQGTGWLQVAQTSSMHELETNCSTSDCLLLYYAALSIFRRDAQSDNLSNCFYIFPLFPFVCKVNWLQKLLKSTSPTQSTDYRYLTVGCGYILYVPYLWGIAIRTYSLKTSDAKELAFNPQTNCDLPPRCYLLFNVATANY